MIRKRHRLAAVAATAAALLALVVAGPAVGQANQPPIADVAATPTSGDIGTFIFFDGSGSADADGTIATYAWDFGDGTPIVSGNRVEAEQIYHSFGTAGTFSVTLIVTDDQGTESDPAAVTSSVDITISSGTVTTTTTAPPATDGAALFTSSCAACHTKADLAGRGLTSADLVTVMTSGLMTAQASSLNATQIQAVADYIVPAGSGGGTPPPTTTTLPGGAVSGSAVYSAKCAACHGGSGQGGVGPSLQASTWTRSATVGAVANGVGSMPGFSGSLSSAEIDAVSSYSVRLQSSSATTTSTTMPAADAGGSQIYASQCAACHGASGGGGIGPSLQASLTSTSETIGAVTNGVGSMPGYAGKLTAEQIASVSAYSVGFQSGDSTGATGEGVEGSGGVPEGAAAVYDANCAACHGASGEGGVGPSLQSSAFDLDTTIAAIANGVGTMPGFSSGLSEELIDAVAQYSVAFQSGEPGTASTDGSDTSAGLASAEGADLYSSNCAVCHGATGEGASAAPINVPFANEQLMEIIRVGIADMPGFATALSDDQIVVLADYVHALAAESAPTTTVPPAEKGSIVAIQPSKYVEFATERSSIPLGTNVQLGFGLASLALLASIAYWEVRRARTQPTSMRNGDG